MKRPIISGLILLASALLPQVNAYFPVNQAKREELRRQFGVFGGGSGGGNGGGAANLTGVTGKFYQLCLKNEN